MLRESTRSRHFARSRVLALRPTWARNVSSAPFSMCSRLNGRSSVHAINVTSDSDHRERLLDREPSGGGCPQPLDQPRRSSQAVRSRGCSQRTQALPTPETIFWIRSKNVRRARRVRSRDRGSLRTKIISRAIVRAVLIWGHLSDRASTLPFERERGRRSNDRGQPAVGPKRRPRDSSPR